MFRSSQGIWAGAVAHSYHITSKDFFAIEACMNLVAMQLSLLRSMIRCGKKVHVHQDLDELNFPSIL